MPEYPGKCANLHGHNYRLEVYVGVRGDDVGGNGLGIDTATIKKIVNEKVIDVLDHSSLNDKIDNPTMENICIWIADQVKPEFETRKVKLYKLRLWETARNSVILHIDK